ncbi:TPA: hypothetical protein KPK48_003219 [Clostridioides difficile]|nr:hypothetical protein [Clostridioides difficile]
MEEYLIKNTTKEQRREFVDGALAIGSIDSREPELDVKKLMDEYVDGNKELENVRIEIIKLYERKYNVKKEN